LANKAGPPRLGFAVLLKVFGHDGRFPRSRQDVAGAAVVNVAKQVGVPAEQYLQYDWHGRAIKYHRAQVRAFFGFHEATVPDGEALVAWLWSSRFRMSSAWSNSAKRPTAGVVAIASSRRRPSVWNG
jgi:hypothetical protein